MIRVTVTLINANNGEHSTLGVLDICNDGKSTDPKRGNYHGRLYKKNPKNPTKSIHAEAAVLNWPRQSYTVWRLVHKMLSAIHGDKT